MKEVAYKKMDEYANRYFWYVGREKIILSLVDTIIDDSVDRIIDYGCGTGELINKLNNIYKNVEVFGADISEKALFYCRDNGINNVLNLNIEKPKKNYYDVVLCLDVIEHIENDTDFLNKVYDLLRIGGKLVLTVPAYNFLWSGEDYISNHIRRYTKGEIKNKIIQAGYKIVKISYFNIFLFIPLVCVLLFKRIFYPKTMYESDLQDINKLTNQILTYIFSSERWLLKLISFPFGASIIAIVKKEK